MRVIERGHIETGHIERGHIEKRRILPRQPVRALPAVRSAASVLRCTVRGALPAGAAFLGWAYSHNEPRRPKSDVDISR